MMKNSKIFFGLAACAALILGLPSCSQDEIVAEDNQPIVTEATAKSYVTVNIAQPKGGFNGRAMGDGDDKFDNGTAPESAISNAFLVFYDNAGRAVATSGVTLNSGTTGTVDDPAVETVYSTTVELGLTPGTNMPTQVVAYINPQDESDQLVSLAEATALTRPAWTKSVTTADGTTKYFTMNNSVYYDAAGHLVIAVPVTAKSTEANNNQFQATIYVERLAAKVKVAKKSSGYVETPVKLNATQTLTFHPEKWALTAVEKKTYLLKKMPAELPADWSAYNDEPNKRSYWAQSYSYESSNFPTTGCDVRGLHLPSTPTYPLNYLTYNNVNTDGVTYGNTGDNDVAYCLENTGRALKWTGAGTNYNPYAAFTSVLLVGNYTVTENGTAKTFGPDGFYIYNNQVYDKTDLISVMSSMQPYIVDDGGTTVGADKFTVAHVGEYRGINHVPSNRVALQLGSDLTGLKYKESSGAVAVDIDDTNLAEVNKKIGEYANSLATHYVNCKAFFYIPIEHSGPDALTGNVINGTYGVVRNHFYKVTINKIENLGYGIHDLNDPLLPIKMDNEKKDVDITFNVNAWHLMSQGVDL